MQSVMLKQSGWRDSNTLIEQIVYRNQYIIKYHIPEKFLIAYIKCQYGCLPIIN